jgi:hypothetical protein
MIVREHSVLTIYANGVPSFSPELPVLWLFWVVIANGHTLQGLDK